MCAPYRCSGDSPSVSLWQVYLTYLHPIALASGCMGEGTGGVRRVLPIREEQTCMPNIPGMVCAYVGVWWQWWVVSGGSGGS